MKAAKQQKKQSIWDQVKNEEKDFYFNYLSKKSRNLQKKLKDIADLEELSKTKELKQEQVQKIQSKEENNEKVKELEAQLSNWLSAKREAEQSGTLLTQEAFILILEHLSENQDTVALLSQDHNSLYELAKLLQNRVNGQLRKKDQPWNGLNLKHQAQSEQHKEVEVVQPLKQESPQPQEIVETHKEQTHQQEQYVLIKSSPKKSFQEEARTQVHQTLDQQTNQHSDNTQQQENTNLESNTNQPQEQQQQPDQQENQEKTHQNREGHRQHHQNDTIIQNIQLQFNKLIKFQILFYLYYFIQYLDLIQYQQEKFRRQKLCQQSIIKEKAIRRIIIMIIIMIEEIMGMTIKIDLIEETDNITIGIDNRRKNGKKRRKQQNNNRIIKANIVQMKNILPLNADKKNLNINHREVEIEIDNRGKETLNRMQMSNNEVIQQYIQQENRIITKTSSPIFTIISVQSFQCILHKWYPSSFKLFINDIQSILKDHHPISNFIGQLFHQLYRNKCLIFNSIPIALF